MAWEAVTLMGWKPMLRGGSRYPQKRMKIVVLGAGSWGTALSILLARNGHEVILWGRNPDEVESMQLRRENFHYLPGFVLPDSVSVETELRNVGEPALWVVAVPSSAVRSVLELIEGASPLVVIASKGLEPLEGEVLSSVISRTIRDARVTALSGPNLAVEIVQGIPTVAVSASVDRDAAEETRAAFMCRTYRIYLSDDIIGVEVAGALKNVLAIGAGMSDGLGFGDNTKGALLARGLNEMTRLGMAIGGRMETFLGIAGVGDLIATGASKLSRNYRVGLALGQGRRLEEALLEIGQTTEGVQTSEAALLLAKRHNIEIPLMAAIEGVIRGRIRPRTAVNQLMERTPRAEGMFTSGGN
jgi:glycerol-3-phosphate dehydrogenase (NAD(P)+)